MSSPGHGHKHSVPPPRSESPAQSGQGHDNGSPRDYSHSGASSSRRTSQSSTHQHHYANQGTPGHGWKSSANDSNGSQQQVRLPRITTVNVDAGTSSGPMSAPLQPAQGRNLLPTSSQSGPLRSSTTPDPRTSPRVSPSNSPIENRPNPVLGPPSSSRGPSPAGSSRSQIPPIAVPPRRSSHMDGGMSSRSSQHSLNDQETPTNVTPLTFPVPQTRTRRGEPTYCGQCGQVVHGQFVRAMGHVYHLNCFRCKVSCLLVLCVQHLTSRIATRS